MAGDLQTTSIYRTNCNKFGITPFAHDLEGKGKTGREIEENGTSVKKANPLSKIPEFWSAKYRCILMGVILFFSVAEILMFNINNFLQGESTKSLLFRFMNEYMRNNKTKHV